MLISNTIKKYVLQEFDLFLFYIKLVIIFNLNKNVVFFSHRIHLF